MVKGSYPRTMEMNKVTSDSLRNYWKDNEKAKEKLSKLLKGRKLSDVTIKKMKNRKVIHHINGNHNDNSPENRIKISQSEHINIHRKQGDLIYSGKKTIICKWCRNKFEDFNSSKRKYCCRECYYKWRKGKIF